MTANAQLKDFIILGGELSNSAATSVDDIDEVLPRMKTLGLNTVLVPIYWELMEPTEGQMDFTLVDRTINVARQQGLKIVPLWFGAWKNSMSCYALNRRYNKQLNGKWDGMMGLAPGLCALYQNKPQVTYNEGVGETPFDLTPKKAALEDCHVIDLGQFIDKSNDAQLVSGIGYDGQVMQLGTVAYHFPQVTTDSIDMVVYTVPFWPLYKGKSNAISISVDDGSPQVFENRFKEYDRTWKDQVLRNGAVCRLRFVVDKSKSSHTIRFTAKDPGQMLQCVIIDWGGLKPAYIGPEI